MATTLHPSGSETRKWGRFQMCLVLVIAVLVLFVRKTDSFVNPQFWAEDGAVFFQDQVNEGASAIIQPYAGYLHLVPRLIAFVADVFFPYSAAPAVYNYLALLAMLVVILNIYSPRFFADYKAMLSLSLVLVPHFKNEVFVNATNSNWILAMLLVVILFKEPPDARFGNVRLQRISDVMAILCCGFSGPLIIFLAPFFVRRWFVQKTRHRFILAALAVLAASIQAVLVLKENPLNTGAPPADHLIAGYCTLVGQRLVGNLFLGSTLPYALNPYVLCVGGLLVFSLAVCFAVKRGKGAQALVLLTVSAAILLPKFSESRLNPTLLLLPRYGARYFYLPYVMFTWTLILGLDKKRKLDTAVAGILLSAILFASFGSGFHSPPLEDLKWKQYSREIAGRQSVTIPINPLGWSLIVHPDHAGVCNSLGEALSRKGRTEEAIRQYQEAIRFKPDYAEAHCNLGVALGMKGQIDEAIRQYQEAIRFKPDYAEAHCNLGVALGMKRQIDEAIGQLQEAVRLKPDFAEAHYNLGVALGMKGQIDEAIRQYQEAIRLKPDYVEAQHNLSRTLGMKNVPAN